MLWTVFTYTTCKYNCNDGQKQTSWTSVESVYNICDGLYIICILVLFILKFKSDTCA